MKTTKVTSTAVAALNKQLTARLPEIISWRHQLHMHPEIAGRETSTREFVARIMSATASTIQPPLLGTDLIAELIPEHDTGRCIGLRADIDALPLTEANEFAHKSAIPGMMHGCGHDGHTAMLLGAATVLSDCRHLLTNRVRFIFQPGEEMACLGRELVAAGACAGLDEIYAIHGWPGLPCGCISTRAGVPFGSGAMFSIRLTGKGCHGAQPENGLNPVPTAGRIAWELQQLHQHYSSKNEAVISVCRVTAGSGANIIPKDALLQGTTRYFDAALNPKVKQAIAAIIERCCDDSGIQWEFDYDDSYRLSVINHPDAVAKLSALTTEYLPEAWRDAAEPTRAMEDFSFFLEACPMGAMLWLGLGENSQPLHNPRFDFNDEALFNGIMMLCLAALAE